MGTFVDISFVTWNLMKETSFWFLIGLIIAGIIHQFIPQRFLQKILGGRGLLPILWASGFGILIPVCSCGIIPVAVALHKKGVAVGPALALCVSAPAVNPAAFGLALATLGAPVTMGYVLTVVAAALILGIVANNTVAPVQYISERKKCGCCDNEAAHNKKGSLLKGFKWSFNTLAVELASALVYGFVVAGIMMVVIPQDIIKSALGFSGLIAYPLTALVGIFMFVCNVGAIPFIASLLSQGALPATAIVFLITGPATNTGQLFLLNKAFGTKAMFLYIFFVPAISILGASVFGMLNPDLEVSINIMDSGGHGGNLWGILFVGVLILALLKQRVKHNH